MEKALVEVFLCLLSICQTLVLGGAYSRSRVSPVDVQCQCDLLQWVVGCSSVVFCSC